MAGLILERWALGVFGVPVVEPVVEAKAGTAKDRPKTIVIMIKNFFIYI
jgi:hypothetical protein